MLPHEEPGYDLVASTKRLFSITLISGEPQTSPEALVTRDPTHRFAGHWDCFECSMIESQELQL